MQKGYHFLTCVYLSKSEDLNSYVFIQHPNTDINALQLLWLKSEVQHYQLADIVNPKFHKTQSYRGKFAIWQPLLH